MAGGPNMRKGFLRHWFAVEVSNFARVCGILLLNSRAVGYTAVSFLFTSHAEVN